jgi:hypothetical protein
MPSPLHPRLQSLFQSPLGAALRKLKYDCFGMPACQTATLDTHTHTHTHTHTTTTTNTHTHYTHTPQAHTHTGTHTTRTNTQTLTIQRCSRGYRKMRLRCLRLRLKEAVTDTDVSDRRHHVLVNLSLHTFHTVPTWTFASSQTWYTSPSAL